MKLTFLTGLDLWYNVLGPSFRWYQGIYGYLVTGTKMSIQFNFYGGNRDFCRSNRVPTDASTKHLLLRVNSGCGDQQTPSGNSAFYQFNVCPVRGSCSIRYSIGKESNILLSQYVRYDTSGTTALALFKCVTVLAIGLSNGRSSYNAVYHLAP
jgi:hypothetical protein